MGSPIASLQLPSPEQLLRENSYRDVRCVDAQDQHYIVASQVAKDEAFRKRAQYYAAKALSRHVREGKLYSTLRVILLTFNDFPFLPEATKYKSNHLTLDAQPHANKLPRIRFTFIDVTLFKKHIQGKPITALSKEEKLYFFLNEAEKLDKDQLTQNDPIIQRLSQQRRAGLLPCS